jgi:uncharacterized repeat protein (TIGR04076 family)
MERRDFICRTGCGFVGLAMAPVAAAEQGQAQVQAPPPPARPRYKIDIEIFEARQDTWCHKKGDKFTYPADWGKICPWLRGSLNDFVRILESGGTLPWKYEKTPYEKVIDANGITTEYVRCPDPTANLVAKITRTRLNPATT